MADYSMYIPVPCWEMGNWVPRDLRPSIYNKIMPWPDGVDPTDIPNPEYFLGERVRFKWGLRDDIHVGEVRQIRLSGGAIWAYQNLQEEISSRYSLAHITYTVHWNGHARWCEQGRIIGRAS